MAANRMSRHLFPYAVTADDVRRVLSSFRLSVCYTLTKEAGADA